mmetsp:Transcript_13534/g.32137  ORF Transcript_13534/g.32137 Transcript_13534/m.32137 type:complete len:298 (-) Transcript_13534:1516-2409(-)
MEGSTVMKGGGVGGRTTIPRPAALGHLIRRKVCVDHRLIHLVYEIPCIDNHIAECRQILLHHTAKVLALDCQNLRVCCPREATGVLPRSPKGMLADPRPRRQFQRRISILVQAVVGRHLVPVPARPATAEALSDRLFVDRVSPSSNLHVHGVSQLPRLTHVHAGSDGTDFEDCIASQNVLLVHGLIAEVFHCMARRDLYLREQVVLNQRRRPRRMIQHSEQLLRQRRLQDLKAGLPLHPLLFSFNVLLQPDSKGRIDAVCGCIVADGSQLSAPFFPHARQLGHRVCYITDENRREQE